MTNGLPTDLDVQVRTHVYAHATLYEQAGRDIDERTTPEHFWRRDLDFYRNQPGYPEEKYPTVDEWRSPVRRMGMIVDKMLEGYRADPGVPPIEEAARVVVLHWILTDRGCNAAPFQLTSFQDWSIATVEHDLMRSHAYQMSESAEWRSYVVKSLAVMRDAAPVRQESALLQDDPLWAELERIIVDVVREDQTKPTIRARLGDPPAASLRNYINNLAIECGLAKRPILETEDHEFRLYLVVQHPGPVRPLKVRVWTKGSEKRLPKTAPGEVRQFISYLRAWQDSRAKQLVEAARAARTAPLPHRADVPQPSHDHNRPFRTGYTEAAPVEVIAAVRTVITDWDGTNWPAVRAVLENAGQPRERIEEMTLYDVRQFFAIGDL